MAGFRRPPNKRINLTNFGKEAYASSEAFRSRFAGYSSEIPSTSDSGGSTCVRHLF